MRQVLNQCMSPCAYRDDAVTEIHPLRPGPGEQDRPPPWDALKHHRRALRVTERQGGEAGHDTDHVGMDADYGGHATRMLHIPTTKPPPMDGRDPWAHQGGGASLSKDTALIHEWISTASPVSARVRPRPLPARPCFSPSSCAWRFCPSPPAPPPPMGCLPPVSANQRAVKPPVSATSSSQGPTNRPVGECRVSHPVVTILIRPVRYSSYDG